MHISKHPARTRYANLPQRDMTTPEIRLPMGAAKEGIASLAPALVGVSNSIT
jgi:hypothetical protein